MTDSVMLKGDHFVNRYRLEGKLTATSPFHLGSGFVVERKGLDNEKTKKPIQVSAIATDHSERPVIPGSSLKGALRGYLLNVLSTINGSQQKESAEVLANDHDYDTSDLKEKKQKDQISFMRESASFLERLFGTPFAEGKIEVWNGECVFSEYPIDDKLSDSEVAPYWNHRRFTYVDQSVAIDPKTNTAIDKNLYSFEIVPPGVTFAINICGQNLSEIEIGMLIFGLEAFNSEIWPLTLGAMGGRGFGRFSFELTELYCLNKDNISNWIKEAVQNRHSGYFSLKRPDEYEKKKAIECFRKAFLKGVGDVR
ncbi:MAG: RAMP superfamily CRISPR-associated protein [Deltaproteobacteria bacterium]|jgi:CRISPR/Cas system CSM-associated protein Csm3 (group 7 of RAMP superfamily)|nr:RAMP superfamily CRISPR-associated protein [Deltaproteobacteria bacterium]MDL1986816.1 RAMP superfamily CRISPR-associated protein [Deltaproteobacteria bacterium]